MARDRGVFVRCLETSSLALVLVAAACNAGLDSDRDRLRTKSRTAATEFASQVPGTDHFGIGPSEIEFGSLAPVVTESGLISLSLDASGSNGGPYQFRGGAAETIRVDKPAGASVRRAFLAAASTGFTGRKLNDGDVTLDGVGISWAISTPSSITSWNHWAEVTSVVKPKIDPAPTGIVSFSVGEVNTLGIEGEILAVIFDDPSQTTSNTVILLFGAQNIAGDTFNITLGSPIDKSDPNLAIDLSLGISFGFQDPTFLVQHSLVDVNGARLTSFAGGQDDGQSANGALMTVGGIGDSNANPSPMAVGPDARGDDELYDLLPFVPDGATTITVFSQNPSNDDNILFASLNLRSAAAIIGEGIILGPSPAPDSEVGTAFTVTATVQDANGQPLAGRTVTFLVTAGPDAGTTGTAVTDAAGHASFTYTGAAVGVDEISASFVDSQNHVQTSNTVLKRWIRTDRPPVAVCQDVTRAVDATCLANVQPAEVGGGSFDPDGDPISLALNPAGPYQLGNTSVQLTATDNSSLSSVCEAVITAIDRTSPTISCPDPTSAECTGNASATVTVGDAAAADNCGSPSVTGPAGTASYPLGSTLLTFTATDGSGNTTSCTTSVTVTDITAPVFDPATLGPRTVVGGCDTTPISFPPPVAIDACQSTTVTCDPLAGDSFGDNQVSCTATDGSGNHTTVTITVTVLQPLRLAFQAPLSDDNIADDINSDADAVNVFEVKRTIPNQIRVFSCDGTDVTRAIADRVTLRLTVSLRDATSSGPGIPIVPSFTGVGGADGELVLTGNHFHYNQETDLASYPVGTINDTRFFDNVVTLTYNVAPSVVAGQEDARLESK